MAVIITPIDDWDFVFPARFQESKNFAAIGIIFETKLSGFHYSIYENGEAVARLAILSSKVNHLN